MNIDETSKILIALLRKWKVIVLFAPIGALLGVFYTANFTQRKLTHLRLNFCLRKSTRTTSLVSQTLSNADLARTSNTSKMNYAMKMLDTYIEIAEPTPTIKRFFLMISHSVSTQFFLHRH